MSVVPGFRESDFMSIQTVRTMTADLTGREVEVYFNLHRRVWSVRHRKTKTVLAHAPSLVLHNCTFHVQQGGRQRVLRERRKNVHAWIRGTLVDRVPDSVIVSRYMPHPTARYNPYKMDQFCYGDTSWPLREVECCVFTCEGQVQMLGRVITGE